MTPPGVRPPLLTTAVAAPPTWRAPAAPRSWVIASCTRPMPWVRPWDSWPPWVLTGISPSSAMRFPPSRKSFASPISQNPRASIQDRQLK